MGKHALPRSKAKGMAYGSILVGGIAIPATFVNPASATTMSAWDRVAHCESSGLWNRPDGDGGRSSGGLQFQPASWDAALARLRAEGIDTKYMPQGPGHQAYKATKNQQILAGEALLAVQGPGAWTCNAKVGSPLGASVFEGGPNPFGAGASLQAVAYGGVHSAPPVHTPKPKPPKAPKPKPVAPGATQGTHTVVSGDTLYDIAIDHGVGRGGLNTWKPLYRANKAVVGDNPHLIFPGQRLTIPGGKSGSQPNSSETNSSATNPGVSKPDKPASVGYQTPVTPFVVTQSYRNPGNYGAGFHTGIDVRAAYGMPIVAAGPGAVTKVGGEGAAYGNHVLIRHNDGRFTLYAHLADITVSAGQKVTGGALVGHSGSTGHSSGAHLHFEVRAGAGGYNDHTDPLAWLRSHGGL